MNNGVVRTSIKNTNKNIVVLKTSQQNFKLKVFNFIMNKEFITLINFKTQK